MITDLMMPEINGEELVTQLKNSDAWKKIPVITLTALADTKNQLNLLRLGIDDYIVKPFRAPELRARVYNLLQNQEERRRFRLRLLSQMICPPKVLKRKHSGSGLLFLC